MHHVRVPPRQPRPADRQLYWAARKLATTALTPEDELLDIQSGNLQRFRDNGTDKEVVTPKKWARLVPLARGLTIVTYTRGQLLFLGDGFAVNCPVICIYRAAMNAQQHMVFAFSRRDSPLAVLELASSAPSGFLERLIAVRDEERAKLPAGQGAELERIDLAVGSQSLDQLWATPPLTTTIELPERLHSALLAAGRVNDGLDEEAWSRLHAITQSAHDGNGYSYTQACMLPEGSGLRVPHRISLYLWYLLRNRIREALHKDNLNGEDLRDLAARLYPKVHEILGKLPENHLEEALRTAFDLPPATTQIPPASFAIIGGAALGVIMTDPKRELENLRPGLATWWSQHHESFRSQGVAD